MGLPELREFRERHGRWTPIVFFVAGFAFDALMLRRIDELKVILQQAAYLAIAALLIGIELIETTRPVAAPRGLGRVWKHRESALHFLLGTLLNSYTIFYFKSASALTSFAFIGLLVGLLVVNEFKHFGKDQTRVHAGFWSLCLISFLASLSPTLLGFIGTLPFLGAAAVSAALCYGYARLLQLRLAARPEILRSHVIIPFAATQSAFVALYFAHVIPPVPLSVVYLGIFHDVQKTPEGNFRLSYTRNDLRFWQHGDQAFAARPGDAVYCYAQVFSPARFHDEIQVRWLYKDERQGWLPADAIPMPITGGREEGFRGFTRKTNYQPGDWRVQIETRDGREIGWIGFRVDPDLTTGERALTVLEK